MAQAVIVPTPQRVATSPGPPTRQKAVSRLPSLDGWRAVSILMVLGGHSIYAAGFPAALLPTFGWTFDSNLGVRFFFIISGFLITWLMIMEKDKTGTISLREFYIRRCLRILPVYLMYLCVLALFQWKGYAKETTQAWIGNVTFTRNSLGGFTGPDSFSEHLWSLSVEEWFYLIWPAIFLLSARKSDRSMLCVLAIPIVVAPAIRGISARWFYPGIFYSQLLKPVFFGNSFFKCFDSLAFGCVCAVLLFRHRETVERSLKSRPFLAAGTGLALALIPRFPNWLPLRGVPLAQFGPSIQALGFSILLLHSMLAPDWFCYRALNWKWVRRIGIWSYSIYIWQQLFWAAPPGSGLNHVWWMGLWMAPLSAATLASYYGLERPFFRLRNRYREVKMGVP